MLVCVHLKDNRMSHKTKHVCLSMSENQTISEMINKRHLKNKDKSSFIFFFLYIYYSSLRFSFCFHFQFFLLSRSLSVCQIGIGIFYQQFHVFACTNKVKMIKLKLCILQTYWLRRAVQQQLH